MKSVRVIVSAIRDGEVVSGVFVKQRKRGDAWLNEESINVVSGEPGSERTFLLGNDQRLIIEGQSDVKIVYDRNQSVALPVQSREPRPEPTPPDTDGTESPATPAVELAQRPAELAALQAQEKRDAAITAARLRLKQGGK